MFLDSGCNTAIVNDGVPQKQFNSSLLRPGPIDIDIATGIKVHANGEWGLCLPLKDGSVQVVRALSIDQVTADMPRLHFRSALKDIKQEHPENEELQRLQVPAVLGVKVDIRFSESGLTKYIQKLSIPYLLDFRS